MRYLIDDAAMLPATTIFTGTTPVDNMLRAMWCFEDGGYTYDFEVFYEGEFIDSRISMSAAKLSANDFYKSKICGILGLFPKKE